MPVSCRPVVSSLIAATVVLLQLQAFVDAQPPGDTPDRAIIITEIPFTIENFLTFNDNTAVADPTGGVDEFFQFTPQTFASEDKLDTVIFVYQRVSGNTSLSEIDFNDFELIDNALDDNGGGANCVGVPGATDTDSFVVGSFFGQGLDLTAGVQYLIAVAAKSIDQRGEYILNITPFFPPNPVLNADVVALANIRSDPHLKGFRGQSFDFMGVPGHIYNFLTTSALALNAKLDVAYASGVDFGESGDGPAGITKKGTWINGVGLKMATTGATLLIASNSAEHVDSDVQWATMCDPEVSAEFGTVSFGAIFLSGTQVCKLGSYDFDDGNLQLRNSRSYSRVAVDTTTIAMKIDIVAPRSSWNVEGNAEHYNHINIAFERIDFQLDDVATGVLGETLNRDWTESNMMTDEEYEVESLL